MLEHATAGLQGMFRDVLRDADGRLQWDSGWRKNTILNGCHRLLAGFIAGAPTATLGVQGLLVGQGLDAWDASGPPSPSPTATALVDPNPFAVPRAAFQIDFLDGATPSATPTNKVQLVVTLGPNVPSWPDANHASGNLREFALFGTLNGTRTLMNYVIHPVIVKDPLSTLTRTIWLVL